MMERKKKTHNKLTVLLLLFLSVTCTIQNEDSNQFHVFESGEWSKNEIITFDLPNVKGKTTPNLYIGHNAAYPYQNLWLLVEYRKDSTIIRKDTIEIQVAKADGNWLGKGHAGLYQLSRELKIPNSNDTTPLSIQIGHGMREISLSGITQIGIEFAETKQ